MLKKACLEVCVLCRFIDYVRSSECLWLVRTELECFAFSFGIRLETSPRS